MTAPNTATGTDRKTWSAAILLALLFHAVLAGVLLVLRPLTPTPVQAREPEPIRFVFAAPPEPDEPRFFSELPEDRADEPPEQPDFLSNVTSRARDEASGRSNLPRTEGLSDAPQVRMDPGQASAAAAPPEHAEVQAPELAEREIDESLRADPVDPGASFLQPRRDRPDPIPPSPAQERLMLLQPPGSQDILQHALDNPDGGTPLSGAISLNTLAWPYAPWLQRFRREFLAGWTAPYAWRMGLIEGTHVLELEIAPSGELLRLDLLQQEGSDALVANSRFSLETMAPYEPLPAGFPEETLILQIQLTYYPVQPRPRRTNPIQTGPRRRRP